MLAAESWWWSCAGLRGAAVAADVVLVTIADVALEPVVVVEVELVVVVLAGRGPRGSRRVTAPRSRWRS